MQVHGAGWSLAMSIVEKRSAARRADYVAQNERMFTATCICLEILVAALAIYALGSAILLQTPSASPSQSKVPAEMSVVGSLTDIRLIAAG
jgi:F0F1-type ATP synthase membrane subunit c/vacuolar-type H+-ATPase subunit K